MTVSDEVTESNERVTGYQLSALVALMLLNVQDGYDILAISFAANAIAQDWQIDRSELGFVLSASLVGMVIGALLLGPLADQFGRRMVSIGGLALSGVGALIAMAAPSVDVLIIGRLLTGIGIGGILPCLNTLVAEFAGKRYRGLAIALFQVGFTAGAFVSGFIVAWFLEIGDWRYVFGFGAFTSFLFIFIVFFLPESMDFLAKSGRHDALEQINKTRRMFGWTPLETLPAAVEKPNVLANAARLFNRQYLARTVLIWLSFFLLLIPLYFVLSWTPKLLVDVGFSEADGNLGGRLVNLIGILGAIVIGCGSLYFRSSHLTTIYLFGISATLLTISLMPMNLGPLLLMISIVGFFLHGSMLGLWATVAALYPTELRATGTGWAIGLSRAGAAIGPALAGILLEGGWAPQHLFAGFALPAAMAGVCMLVLCLTVRFAE